MYNYKFDNFCLLFYWFLANVCQLKFTAEINDHLISLQTLNVY